MENYIIIIIIYCNWVVTRWQWLFYVYTKYEIGYCIVGPDRPQMAIWRMHVGYWITKVTNTLGLCNAYWFCTVIVDHESTLMFQWARTTLSGLHDHTQTHHAR